MNVFYDLNRKYKSLVRLQVGFSKLQDGNKIES